MEDLKYFSNFQQKAQAIKLKEAKEAVLVMGERENEKKKDGRKETVGSVRATKSIW